MSLQEALLDAIRADPEDNTPRLVYADWLDENGTAQDRARAEFIRLQCALARLESRSPQRPALESREAYLLEWNRRSWLGALDEFCTPASFRRGFPEVVVLEHDTLTREFIARAEGLFSLGPLFELLISYGAHAADPEVLRALAEVPALAHFRVLRVENAPQVSEPALQALLASPHWTGLRGLCLAGTRLTPLGVRTLAANSSLAGLTALDLSETALGVEGAQALALSPHLRSLRKAKLANASLEDEGVVLLAGSPCLAQVRVLDLRYNGVGARAVEALIRAPFAELGQLCLREGQGQPRDSSGMPVARPSLPEALVKRLRQHFGPRLVLDSW